KPPSIRRIRATCRRCRCRLAAVCSSRSSTTSDSYNRFSNTVNFNRRPRAPADFRTFPGTPPGLENNLLEVSDRTRSLQECQYLATRRDWGRAKHLLQSWLEEFPGDSAALVQLSYIESLAGSYRAARDAAVLAARSRPADPTVLSDLFSRLRTFNEVGALRQLIDDAGPPERWPVPLLLHCAWQMAYLNLPAAAIDLVEKATERNLGLPPILLLRAQASIHLGLFERARDLLEQCLAKMPQAAQAHWLMSQIA